MSAELQGGSTQFRRGITKEDWSDERQALDSMNAADSFLARTSSTDSVSGAGSPILALSLFARKSQKIATHDDENGTFVCVPACLPACICALVSFVLTAHVI